MKNQKTLVLLGVMLGAVGCQSGPQTVPGGPGASTTGILETVNITFDSGNCPIGVNKTVSIPKTSGTGSQPSRVQWQSVDGSGSAIAQDYEIFFDPFQGRSISSNATTGATAPSPVNGSTPINVTFKYTIVGTACTSNALDPRIIIY